MDKDNEYVKYIFEIKRKNTLALLEALYFGTEIPRTVAISATPLVRCKDCKFYLNSSEKCVLIDTRLHFYETDKKWTEEDYCSWGEEKNDG